MKYKYTGSGIMTFNVDGKDYTVGVNPRLKTDVELPRKLKKEELDLIGGLEEIKTKNGGDQN